MAARGIGIRTRQYNPLPDKIHGPEDWKRLIASRLLERYDEWRRSGLSHQQAIDKTLSSSTAGPGSVALFKSMLKRNPKADPKTGLHVEYSPVNQAYFVMWHNAVLNVVNSRAEAKDIVKDLTRKNPEGASNLAQYVMAAMDHTRGAHDAGGAILHATPKSKRREFAKEIWWRRGYRNGKRNSVAWGRNPGDDPWMLKALELLYPGKSFSQLTAGQLSQVAMRAAKLKHGKNPPEDVMREFRAGKLRSSAGRLVKKPRQAKAILLSELRRLGRIPARVANPNIVDAIRPGDRVTILTPHGNKLTGRAVMRSSSGGWVLNLGGRHGTPGIADEENILKVKPAKRNPAGAAGADALYEKFHGRAPEHPKTIDVEFVDPYERYPDLAQLGKLLSLTVGEFIEKMEGRTGDKPVSSHPDNWAFTIDFDERTSADVAAEPGAKQIFFVGGNQNIDDYLEEMGADPDKDPIDLGFVYRIEYLTRKGFDQFRPVDYWHHFGEDTGVQPRLIYDRTNHRLQLAGGEYVVKGEGIVN